MLILKTSALQMRMDRSSVCTTLALAEDRRHLGIKNKRVYFVLRSVCTIFEKFNKVLL